MAKGPEGCMKPTSTDSLQAYCTNQRVATDKRWTYLPLCVFYCQVYVQW